MAIDKAVDSAVLDGYFEDIADAIRNKGGSGTFAPEDMPGAIETLPLGDSFSDVARGEATELVFDYGNKTSLTVGCQVLFRPDRNAHVKKIKFITAVGAEFSGSDYIIASRSNTYNGYALEEVDLGNLVSTTLTLGNNDLGTWPHMTTLKADHLKHIINQYFMRGSALQSVKLPKLINAAAVAFQDCRQMELAELGTSDLDATGFTPNLSTMAFNGCMALKALIMRPTNFYYPIGDQGTLRDTPIATGTGYIYVPRALISTYESASNWSVYAGQFRAIEDYTDDGTIDGEFIMPT